MEKTKGLITPSGKPLSLVNPPSNDSPTDSGGGGGQLLLNSTSTSVTPTNSISGRSTLTPRTPPDDYWKKLEEAVAMTDKNNQSDNRESQIPEVNVSKKYSVRGTVNRKDDALNVCQKLRNEIKELKEENAALKAELEKVKRNNSSLNNSEPPKVAKVRTAPSTSEEDFTVFETEDSNTMLAKSFNFKPKPVTKRKAKRSPEKPIGVSSNMAKKNKKSEEKKTSKQGIHIEQTHPKILR
ncbi:uncharacterized protein LOC129616443 [Condylostylus longicornis]|uniref:uncharacterized protein LOC129616443 n=1 Tax=Condylostylus longicornis TaxID=2530218 RepID=UPI00244E3216|nr:uncharacterized protein LOC129616443 [Condylostylus longicornis]